MGEVSRSIIYSITQLNIHSHELILNENCDSGEGDLCYVCGLVLHSPSDVYGCIYFKTSQSDGCARFFLHQTCAHLPCRIEHPIHKYCNLNLTRSLTKDSCDICGIKSKGFYYSDSNYQICVLCIAPLHKFNIDAAYHRHKLTLSTRLATFQCDACHQVDTDLSYMCYTCPFWIHVRCSNLPNLLECKIHHKHPLRIAYSLPQVYRRFPQTCRICTEKLNHSHWLYYCPNCRFIAHIKCATLPRILRWENYRNESNVVNLPAPFHESLLQQCIKKKTFYWLEDAPVRPPLHIKHWSHEHQMVLGNKSGPSTTEDEELLICNGCTKSVNTSDDVFYECSECEYILHRYCALFPKKMQLDLFPDEMQLHLRDKLVGIQPSVHDIWSCTCCGGLTNGTQMQTSYIFRSEVLHAKLDTECALLPQLLKHEGHPHLLRQVPCKFPVNCFACHKNIRDSDAAFACWYAYCSLFYLHKKCALKPSRVTHRWDPHPLHLIFSPEEVMDHPHEFHCEFCSEEIDTNCWFYHCSVCDLSFHLEECIDLFPYSRVKFGATNIKIRDHEHNLSFVLNKKRRRPCQRCHKDTYGKPVLECTPCKFIQHAQPELCT